MADQKSAYLQKHQIPELIDSLINKLVDAMPANPKQFLADQLTSAADSKFTAAESFPNLSHHSNIMSKYLTPEMYAKLKDKKTPNGVTLDDCIQVGVDNPGHPYAKTIGIVAGDEESYDVFAELFDPVIDDRHGGYPKTAIHKSDVDPSKLRGGQFEEEYVVSVRVRTGRSIRGLRLPPNMSRAERRSLEKIVVKATEAFQGQLSGKYFGVYNMTPEDIDGLVHDHLLFEKPITPYLTSARIGRDWPDSRGVFHNTDRTFAVWVNTEDHVRIISMQKGGNMKECFERFADAVSLVEESVKRQGHEFMYNDHLGFILTCPSNLGTGIRAGVHIKIPNLSADPKFQDFLKKWRLAAKSLSGDAIVSGGIWDISNVDRLGKTETELVQIVIDGVNKCIELEKVLADGGSIEGRY